MWPAPAIDQCHLPPLWVPGGVTGPPAARRPVCWAPGPRTPLTCLLPPPAWTSVRPSAPGSPSWSAAASGAWGPPSTSGTGGCPPLHAQPSAGQQRGGRGERRSGFVVTAASEHVGARSSSSVFWKDLWRIGLNFLLNVCEDSPGMPPGPGTFFLGSFKITNFISPPVTGPFAPSFFLSWVRQFLLF